jgi:hypothetical protein
MPGAICHPGSAASNAHFTCLGFVNVTVDRFMRRHTIVAVLTDGEDGRG